MAKIVMGIGSSHGPQLSLPPDEWWRRAEADKRNPELWYQGRPYQFDELAEKRAGEGFEREITPEKMKGRFEACQRDIEKLAQSFAQVRPDVAVIFGDDQHESFLEDNMPAMSVYWGETVDTAPRSEQRGGERGQPGLWEASWGHAQEERATHPCQADLGRHVIECLIREEFDVAHSHTLPAGRHGGHGIGHAFGFVYRRIMSDEVVPHVPIFLNTYYPPNQPTLKRCYELGRAVRRAIERWDSDKTVAVIASGGLTHFVIEEDLDQQVIAALQAKDGPALASMPVERFNSGTSEIRNWVATAGAMADGDLGMELVDYVPCYRSVAGTGCAMAFATWT